MSNAAMFTDEELAEPAAAPAPAPINPFQSTALAHQASNVLAATDQSRAIAEIQAAMTVAKRFPRNQVEAMDRILMTFSRPGLAETALYAYSRGGTDITGLSIRAAEAIAQSWGNLQFGIRELEQRNGESSVEAYCWDVETNTRRAVVFQVPHIRHTKNKTYKLEDPRDIYENVANQGSRRLRACILAIIPGDVQESARRQVDVTLKTKIEVTPELIKSLNEKFAEYGVTVPQIEKRIQRRMDAITPGLVVNLGKIYNSLKDGMSAPADWFEAEVSASPAAPVEAPSRGAAGLKAAVTKKTDTKVPEQVDKDTGEVNGPSYANIASMIAKSRNQEQYDMVADLIRQLPDEQQRAELQGELTARIASIAGQACPT